MAQAYIKRLSLAELKEQAAQNVSNNLEAIKGGVVGDCHSLASQAAEEWRIFQDSDTYRQLVQFAQPFPW